MRYEAKKRYKYVYRQFGLEHTIILSNIFCRNNNNRTQRQCMLGHEVGYYHLLTFKKKQLLLLSMSFYMKRNMLMHIPFKYHHIIHLNVGR